MAPVCFSIAKFDVKWVSQPSKHVRKCNRKRLCISGRCYSPWSRVQSRENLRISVFLPSRCYKKKVGFFFVSVRALLSLLDNDGRRTHSTRLDVCVLPSAPLARGAAESLWVCPRGVRPTAQPYTLAASQSAVSSECVVSIRLLLLCQGKRRFAYFFRSFLCSSCFLISRQRLLVSDVSLK